MNSTHKNIILILFIIIFGAVGYIAIRSNQTVETPLDPTPQNVTLSGAYVCLPHINTRGPQTDECAFGLKTEDGTYYAVNFGAGAGAMEQFQTGQYIKAEGFVVIKEALSSDQWAKYNMKGIFTVTKIIEPVPSSSINSKLDINAICGSALAYMSFPNGASAQKFLEECKEGKHPEVIERYKAETGLGNGEAI